MMGRENPPPASLFYTGINLDKQVRSDHVELGVGLRDTGSQRAEQGAQASGYQRPCDLGS